MSDSGKIPDAGPIRPTSEGAATSNPERRADHVIGLACDDCGSLFYSAAAATMVERGERCSVCGGHLALAEAEPGPGMQLAVGAEPGSGDDEPGTGGRGPFGRH
ncbi:MAG: hypothetical protein NVSMB25_10090 [Thermoleophilaceae bacterium]